MYDIMVADTCSGRLLGSILFPLKQINARLASQDNDFITEEIISEFELERFQKHWRLLIAFFCMMDVL